MMPSHYDSYYYQNNQQSSAQQHPADQRAAARSAGGHYQRAPRAATTQTTDYMSYPSQCFNTAQVATRRGAEDQSWGGSSDGHNRDSTGRAAEVLRNMSNNTYNSKSTTGASSSAFITTNAGTTGQYSTSTFYDHQPHAQSHTPRFQYGQTHVHTTLRPHSVNAGQAQSAYPNRGLPSPSTATAYPLQRTQAMPVQQQQRPANSAEPRSLEADLMSVNSVQSPAISAASQYNDLGSRQLTHVDTLRNVLDTTIANTPGHYTHQTSAPMNQITTSGTGDEQYNQSTVTVDPTAVYNPWRDYRREQDALRLQKSAAEAVQAEDEPQAKEAPLKRERKKKEKKAPEAHDKARQARLNAKLAGVAEVQEESLGLSSASASSTTGEFSKEATDLELEIRAMMAKMRELNSKDPALLARIWEEERKAKGPKSPTVQNKANSQATTAAIAQASMPQTANQRKKVSPIASAAASSTAVSSTVHVPQLQVSATPAAAVIPPKPAEETIWPADKKSVLAQAAATYLTSHTAHNTITSDTVIIMLDRNPSYIELCEQLERMGLQLDRASFAKALLTAVPDVNSTSRKSQAQARPTPRPITAQVNNDKTERMQSDPPAVAARTWPAISEAPILPYAPGDRLAVNKHSSPNYQDNISSASYAPVAKMIVPKFLAKPPVNKVEAARKRNFRDLIDLTGMDEEEDMPPPLKKRHVGQFNSQYQLDVHSMDSTDPDNRFARPNNFPVAASVPLQTAQLLSPSVQPAIIDNKFQNVVDHLDKRKALRRNTYNIKTIARDILLACGRHPDEKALNAHLEVLKDSFSQVDNNADLSTFRWDLVDPGSPPTGYFQDRSAPFAADDADDEDDSEVESRLPAMRTQSVSVGGGSDARVHTLAEGTNPFKVKRRGRPPRQSLPASVEYGSETPSRPFNSTSHNMSDTGPNASYIGYSAFRLSSDQLGPDGQPAPKKRGRPVGWRKAIHGSPTVQQSGNHPNMRRKPSQQFASSHSSNLRTVTNGDNDPIVIGSPVPDGARQASQYQSFKCRWHICQAELHNLETLKKHVHKVHHRRTFDGYLECLWDGCGRRDNNRNPATNTRMERGMPSTFIDDKKWREHLEIRHFSPLSWEQGDGPASGLSDAHDSEAFLSDTKGRRVTPRVTADPAHLISHASGSPGRKSHPIPVRGRGRPPKPKQEADSYDVLKQVLSQKNRVGGPGMDRGGATLVNDKRRKGFNDKADIEEEFVDSAE